MNDAGFVRFRERIGHLAGDVKRLLERRPSASEQLPERRAFDELHDDEELAVEFPDVMDGDDAGVVQCGRRLGFVLEPPDGARVGQRFSTEHFDRDVAAQLQIPCAIDLAHATRAEWSNDLVSAALGTRSEGHRSSHGSRERDEALASGRLTASRSAGGVFSGRAVSRGSSDSRRSSD